MNVIEQVSMYPGSVQKKMVVFCKQKIDGSKVFYNGWKGFHFYNHVLTILGQYFLILISKLAYSFHHYDTGLTELLD